MTPNRLRKRLTRALMVTWREQPTRYDIEALQANIRRVGLVIRVRWALLGVLVAYSLLAGFVYSTRMPVTELAGLMMVPAVALGFVVLYNTFYTINYRRLGNIAVWNNLQLALDAVVVSVLVFFSGGVESWFWSMYALFILEATFILPTSRGAWVHALFSCGLLGAIEWLEFAELLPHVAIPFSSGDLYHDAAYVAIRYMWQCAVLLGTASVATLIVGDFRRNEANRQGQRIIDETTGLYSRSYFMRATTAELGRAQRDERSVHVILGDLDNFGGFNNRFGIDAGDELLQRISQEVTRGVMVAGDLNSSPNVVARYGGEEFAILFAEDERVDGSPSVEAAIGLADAIRKSVTGVTVQGAGVTMSMGVATLPRDGVTIGELLDNANAALVLAAEAGGNRVCAAHECDSVADDDAETARTLLLQD